MRHLDESGWDAAAHAAAKVRKNVLGDLDKANDDVLRIRAGWQPLENAFETALRNMSPQALCYHAAMQGRLQGSLVKKLVSMTG